MTTGVPPSVTPNCGLIPVTTGTVVAEVVVLAVDVEEGAVVLVVLWQAAPVAAAAAIKNT